jgi:uncharacterized membrane protein YqjE
MAYSLQHLVAISRRSNMDTGIPSAAKAASGAGSGARSAFSAATALLQTVKGLGSDIVDLAAAEGQVALNGVRSAMIFAVIGALLLAFGAMLLLAFLVLVLMALFDLSVITAVGLLMVLTFVAGGVLLWQAKSRGKDMLFPATRRQIRQLGS